MVEAPVAGEEVGGMIETDEKLSPLAMLIFWVCAVLACVAFWRGVVWAVWGW